MPTTHERGYTATKDQLQNRLRRIEGQVRGVQRMVDEDRVCTDILVQIAAIEAALDKVALGLLDGHVKHCVASADENERTAQTTELMEAMARFMRR
jgi:CsoR family transcriptional regulator, copper-sensing transcriptional repressor